MNPLVIVAGSMVGLGIFAAVSQLVPGRPKLDAALARIHAAGGQSVDQRGLRAVTGWIGTAVPWLPVPAADLALLGKEREQWMVSKVVWGLAGLGAVPLFGLALAMVGYRFPWVAPAFVSLLAGVGLFFAPDLVIKVNAAEKRADFRHALTSYLDLVALERGAGAGPTDSLEAAAQIGGGWAFARIAMALDAARKASRPPWEGLASLAAETGVTELADLAEIAEVAGHEGARILQTLAARAESMRNEALAATKAKAGSRSTTMVVPIAVLGMGFLILLIFPVVYRTFL
ncbi:MAG TPA: type II secretion system F family protein [Streptosporangiaceae bacterium]|nr:type II secretion system F family protein [Streptosporangiaceae bacterium]